MNTKAWLAHIGVTPSGDVLSLAQGCYIIYRAVFQRLREPGGAARARLSAIFPDGNSHRAFATACRDFDARRQIVETPDWGNHGH